MAKYIVFFIGCFILVIFRRKVASICNYDIRLFVLFLAVCCNLNYPIMIQYGLRLLTIVLCFLCFFNNNSRFIVKKEIGWMFIYAIIALCSTVYSVDRISTLIKAVEIICDIFLLSSLFRDGSEETIENSWNVICLGILWLECIQLIGFVLFRSSFSVSEYSGIMSFQFGGGFLGANSVGCLSLYIFIWLVTTKYKIKPILKMLAYTAILICILFAQSRTSIGILAVLLALYLIRSERRILKRFGKVFFAIAVFIIAVSNTDLINRYLTRGMAESNLETMTGRTLMWEMAEQYIKKSPWIGYGYGAGGKLVSMDYFNMTSMHNGFYEIMLGIGVIGLIPVILSVIQCIGNIVVYLPTLGYSKIVRYLMIVVYLVARTYVSTGIGSWQSPDFILWLFLIFSLSNIKNESVFENNLERPIIKSQ